MYPEYFGLQESSFSITPDPRYLYLSHQHQEALAHLLYGATEGGGFVLLTGEVGTGKTTVCRAFLEQLPDSVDVALVLNPALTVQELLHTVCDEFGIDIPADVGSSRLLLEQLNHYLLQAHAAGRHTVLLIDEAQNLSPAVLEQIRLLTNLETHRHKLLQIFLIGQPELGEMLRQPELRQLAQRITARYHLRPLSSEETRRYIRHRLAVAGAVRALFTPAALRRIHRLSNGIPRVINILCDRTLLGAYATRRSIVGSRIVNRAFREIRGVQAAAGGRSWQRLLQLAPALMVLSTATVWLGYESSWRFGLKSVSVGQPTPLMEMDNRKPPPDRGKKKAGDETMGAPLTPTRAAQPMEQATAAPPMPQSTLNAMPGPEQEPATPPPASAPGIEDVSMDRGLAINELAAQWQLPPAPDPVAGDPCMHLRQQGVRCRQNKGSWEQIRFHDRPTLIALTLGGGNSAYALVTGIGPDLALLETTSGQVEIRLESLTRHWNGAQLLLWRPPPGGGTLIGPGSPPPYINWLRQALGRAGIPLQMSSTANPTRFDPSLRQAVKVFQQRLGLQPDGLAGPETLIQLNNATNRPNIPHLKRME